MDSFWASSPHCFGVFSVFLSFVFSVVKSRGGGGGGGVLPYISSAQRGRDFEAPDLERGIHFDQRRFLERGIKFRTHESSSFVSSHLKLFKDRLLLKIRFSALTSKLLYSCCTLSFSVQGGRIKNWPISRTGISFRANSRTGYKKLAYF